ncbi:MULTISPECIES: preprotein translocase subunit SecE [Tepidiphilus]|jgi:preprotein translocase subunit SecE|uniref:Protein translocase subunit SecE n=1 Tax=Tepidiphilus baoligensis TaxID=2698687 RepID=A0ABX1QIB1_9PROT|nr:MULTISPECIES: preprotein translocase subunit SecE [Tepidiphilus]NMH15522.1 preprotein translocase subunit SecE [Tepidiphilus baoligensis]
MDRLKFIAALVLLAAGIAGFYVFADLPSVARGALVVVGVLAAGGISLFATEAGAKFREFARGTVAEVRKVVWPSRKETIQSTLIVFAFVTAMAIFLWLVDKTLEWGLYDLILGWK